MSLNEGSLGKKGRRRLRRAVLEKARTELFYSAERFIYVAREMSRAKEPEEAAGLNPDDSDSVGRMVERHLESVLTGQKRPSFIPVQVKTQSSSLRLRLTERARRIFQRRLSSGNAKAGSSFSSGKTPGVQSLNAAQMKPLWVSKMPALEHHPVIVLYRPEIPPNTGTIARLCAAFRMKLVLIGPVAFDLSEKAFIRAGLDYWPWVDMSLCESWEEFLEKWPDRRLVFFETFGSLDIGEFDFGQRDALVFGPETSGVPEELLSRSYPQGSSCLRIPMWQPAVRSINLANSVSIAATHALHGKSRRV